MMNMWSPSSVSQSSTCLPDPSEVLQWEAIVAATVSPSPPDLPATTASWNDVDVTGSGATPPCLVVKEQPVSKFRFRYRSEVVGAHGNLVGQNSQRYSKTYPSVDLVNYTGTAIIRCSLYTAESRGEKRSLHTHRLVVRQGGENKDDPHDISVSPDVGYTAVFEGMGIIHTPRKFVVKELIKKKSARLLEKYGLKNQNVTLSIKDECEIRAEAEAEAKRLNLNSVSLCFEAFEQDSTGNLMQLCEPVFSCSINNMKSALTGELKICRIDRHVSSCAGGDEVFMLVEKVDKKKIKVKFSELDEEGNEVWHGYGRFSELDVHHQYAIVFRTPPYRDLDIEKHVDVYIQLERVTDGACSEPIKYQYKPSERIAGRPTRKRHRLSETLPQEVGNANVNESNNCATTVEAVLTSSSDPILSSGSGEFERAESPFNPDDFLQYLYNLTPGDFAAHVDLSDLRNAALEIDVDGETSNQSPKRSVLKGGKLHGEKSKTFETAKNLQNTGEEATKMKEMEDKMKKENNTFLHMAVMYNRPNYVATLLKQGASANIFNCNQESVVHLAVVQDDTECLRQLLDPSNYPVASNRPNLDKFDDEGETPLHAATRRKKLEAVELLVKAGANVDEQTQKQGNTALHIAVEENCLEIVRFLVQQAKAEIDARNLAGNTPLHISCVVNGTGSVDICRFLMKNNADPCMANYTVGSRKQKSRTCSGTNSDEEEDGVISPLELVPAKKEPLGEDELHPAADNGNGEVALGQTSFDLASGNREILDLLQQTEHSGTRSESPSTLVVIKQEPEDVHHSTADSAEDDD